MSFEEAVVLLVFGSIVLIIQVCAFFSLMHTCAVLKKENLIYRQFFEQQYYLESDCLDACCKMIRESVETANPVQRGPSRYVRQPFRSQKGQ